MEQYTRFYSQKLAKVEIFNFLIMKSLVRFFLWPIKLLKNHKSLQKSYIQDVINQLEIKYNIPIAVMHASLGNLTDFALNPNGQGLKNFERF